MNRMKEYRLQKGMKQKELAMTIGLSKAAISLYESGKSIPSMKNAFKVAEVLGVTVDDLFGTVIKGNKITE